jgi:hypothetical protein
MAHSKVLVTLIICIGIISSFVIVSKRLPSQTSNTQKNQNILAINDNTANSDTDNDGLKDWEEGLIGTDPQNPDTDNDQTTDGDEVSQGRDPRKSGPNDKNTARSTEGVAKIGTESEIGLTEQVAKDFFSRYIAAKQQNKDLTQDEAALIAQSVIQNVAVPVTMRVYTIKDLRITKDISLISKDTYQQSLTNALSKNSPKNIENELVIFARALTSQKESDLLPMDLIIQGYKGIITDTLKATVPTTLVADHLLYLNALSAIYDDLTYMRLILSDPIKAYAGFSNYQRDALKLKVTLENLGGNFTQ